MNKAVFIDRDGTINKDVPYCSSPEYFQLLHGVAKGIKLLNIHGFKVIVITNQSGIARGYFTEEKLTMIHDKMRLELDKHGAYVDDIFHCAHHPNDNCDCRKPKTKMIFEAALKFNVDLTQSYVIGDSPIDIEMGMRAGCKTILVGHNSESKKGKSYPIKPDYTASNLAKAAQLIIDEVITKCELH